MEQKGVVYAIINSVNNKRYVGSTFNIKERWKYHSYLLKKGKHHSIALQRAYNKYGENAFRFEVLENDIEIRNLIKREQFYIDEKSEYNSMKIAYLPPRQDVVTMLYDINGKLISCFPNLKSCCKSINSCSRYGYNKGFFVLKECDDINEIINKHMGIYGRNKKIYKFSKEGELICFYNSIREALSDCGNPKSGNVLITKSIKKHTVACGFRWSLSENIIMRKDLRGWNKKPIIAKDKKTGEILKFESIKKCCEKLGINKTTVQRSINGTTNNGLKYDFSVANS